MKIVRSLSSLGGRALYRFDNSEAEVFIMTHESKFLKRFSSRKTLFKCCAFPRFAFLVFFFLSLVCLYIFIPLYIHLSLNILVRVGKMEGAKYRARKPARGYKRVETGVEVKLPAGQQS